MIVEHDRVDGSRQNIAQSRAVAYISDNRTPKPRCTALVLILLIAMLLTVGFSAIALAEPSDVPDDEALSAAVASDEETRQPDTPVTPDASEKAGKGSSNRSTGGKASVRPESGTNGKFLFDEYVDPGAEQEQKSLVARFFQTAVDIIKYVFYFAVVIVIGFLAIYGVKLFTTKYNSIAGGHELIHILEVRYLAPGKAVCLVEVAGKILVVGLAGNNINPIAEIDDFEQVEALKHLAAEKPEPLQPFQAYLEKFGERFNKAKKKPSASTRRPAKREREPAAPAEENNHWRDDIRSTGENINRILEEIKKQDSKRSGGPSSTRGKGKGDRDR